MSLYDFKGEASRGVVDDLVLTVKELGLEASLAAVEKIIITRLIAEVGLANKNFLASQLRLSRPTLYRLLRKHGLSNIQGEK